MQTFKPILSVALEMYYNNPSVDTLAAVCSSVNAIDRAYNQAQKAIESNRRVLQIAFDRYQGGIANSQDVIIAQQSQLNSERLAAQLLGQRLLTSVFLVKALGGDWQAAGSSGAP